MTDHVTITTQNRVTTVTMARPDKRNAISQAMYAKMAQALRDYGENDDARALVITGEGRIFHRWQRSERLCHWIRQRRPRPCCPVS